MLEIIGEDSDPIDEHKIEQLRRLSLAIAKKLGAKYIWRKGKRYELDWSQKDLSDFGDA